MKSINSIIILLVILFMFISGAVYSTDSISVYSNDTISVYRNSVIRNNLTEQISYSDMAFLESKSFFKGYLVVKIDSKSYYRKYDNANHYTLVTSVFWVNFLNEIEIDTCHLLYYPNISLHRDGIREYNSGKRDDLSVFLYYWNYYNEFNLRLDDSNVNYLYYFKDGITSDSLINKTIFTLNNARYIIFESRFNSVTIKLNTQNRKILIPTSKLIYFKPIEESSYVTYSDVWKEEIITKCGFQIDYSKIRVIVN